MSESKSPPSKDDQVVLWSNRRQEWEEWGRVAEYMHMGLRGHIVELESGHIVEVEWSDKLDAWKEIPPPKDRNA